MSVADVHVTFADVHVTKCVCRFLMYIFANAYVGKMRMSAKKAKNRRTHDLFRRTRNVFNVYVGTHMSVSDVRIIMLQKPSYASNSLIPLISCFVSKHFLGDLKQNFAGFDKLASN